MPTMPASAGISVGWNGKLASLPRTKNTVSPTPAPTESTATSVRPASWPSAPIGWRMSSLVLSKPGSLRVATTSPITRASCTALLRDVDVVDDADDGGVDRHVLHAGGHPGGAAADDQHGFADPGVHRIDGHQIIALGLALGIDPARQQQLAADQARILPRRDNGTDNAREKHG